MSDERAAETADEGEAVAEDADGNGTDIPDDLEAGGEADEGTGADDGDGIGDGDFVRLAYTIRTVDDGQLVDTTDETVAEDEGIDVEGREFGPRTIVVGANHVFAAVEADLVGRDVGDTGTVTIEAADAFGEYDRDRVRTVSADRIPEDQRYPGAHVNLDGQHGHVETVIGGRSRVDFNHPLAGEDIEYEYEVVDVVEDREERARGLLAIYLDDLDFELHIETDEEEQAVYDEEGEEVDTETVDLDTLYIEATPQLSMNQSWLFTKQRIADELIDRLGLDRVIVREVFDGSGGPGGPGGLGGLEEMVEDADVDAEELVEGLDEDELGVEDIEE